MRLKMAIAFSIVFGGWAVPATSQQLPADEGGKSYFHKAELSRFDPGAGARRDTEWPYERLVGDRGVFLTDRITGATLAVPSAPAVPKPPVDSGGPQTTSYPRPLTDNADAHSAEVRRYLVSAGIREEEVSGTHVTTTMAGGGPVSAGVQPAESRLLWYTTHLDRAVGGVVVEGSYAFAALDADGRAITEGAYWPPLSARVVERAQAFRRKLESGTGLSDFQAAVRRQQPIVREATGEVKIVHTAGSYHGEFVAQALYVVVVRNPNGGKAQILRFDDTGAPVRMPDEVPSGFDSEKQR
jgi:hypothetical protein